MATVRKKEKYKKKLHYKMLLLILIYLKLMTNRKWKQAVKLKNSKKNSFVSKSKSLRLKICQIISNLLIVIAV